MSKKNHLSRLAAPRSWPISRKGIKWIAKPTPGAHNTETALPLVVLVRDILNITGTSKEVKKLVHSRDLLVNQRSPKDIRLPVGLFDIISFPKAKLNYRLIFSRNGKLEPEEIKAGDANSLPVKIKTKTTIRGGKTQLNLSNGWNVLVNKDTYRTNDVVVIDLSNGKIKEHRKFGAGKEVYVTGGKQLGITGKLKAVKQVGLLKKENIAVLESKGDTFKTRAEYLFVNK